MDHSKWTRSFFSIHTVLSAIHISCLYAGVDTSPNTPLTVGITCNSGGAKRHGFISQVHGENYPAIIMWGYEGERLELYRWLKVPLILWDQLVGTDKSVHFVLFSSLRFLLSNFFISLHQHVHAKQFFCTIMLFHVLSHKYMQFLWAFHLAIFICISTLSDLNILFTFCL